VQVAAKYNHTEVVRMLIETGARVDGYDFLEGFSMLCRGMPNRLATAKILVEHGLKIDQVDEEGNTFLHYACHRAVTSAAAMYDVELPLDLGLEIDALSNNSPKTALGIAGEKSMVSLVRYLLSKGADVNANDGMVMTHASNNSRRQDPGEISKCLFDAGAIIDEEHIKLLGKARRKCWSGFVRHLLDAWKSRVSTEHCERWPGFLGRLLNAWKSPVATEHSTLKSPETVFLAAAAAGDMGLLQDLLRLGVVTADCNGDLTTPLIEAAANAQDDVVETPTNLPSK
jgi:ankyrin repeat protein